MKAAAALISLLALPAHINAQFGNLRVEWNAAGEAKLLDANGQPPSPPAERYTNLNGLSIKELSQILKSLSLSCEACTTEGHWISRIRAGIFELPLKALKAKTPHASAALVPNYPPPPAREAHVTIRLIVKSPSRKPSSNHTSESSIISHQARARFPSLDCFPPSSDSESQPCRPS